MKKPVTKARPKEAVAPTLAQAAASAGLGEPELGSIWRWLEEQLLADQHAKLGQAGHTETRIPLRQVFVDLPVGESPGGYHEASRRPFLKELNQSKPRLLCPAEESKGEAPPHPGAFLLIGGPGQGKSTLSQFAALSHRAALLRQRPGQPIPTVRPLLEDLWDKATKDQRPRRLLVPLFVPLPEFATWMEEPREGALAAGKPNPAAPAIVQFLADRPSAIEAKLKAETLWAISRVFGVLLVLDGFDEVGDPGIRARLVEAARTLLSDLSASDTPVTLLATTRPQGYTGEFTRLGLRLNVRYLLPLQIPEALTYGACLIRAKIQGADQQQRIRERLEQAANDEVAARLLATPLQVTILAALLEQHGRVPRERWRLFSGYFEYTYNREVERGTYASALLADQRVRIERLHERIALLLQVQAELETASAAYVGRDQLREVTRGLWAADGVDAEEAEELAGRVVQAAEQRLVFLVEPSPGRFGFEIRPLQEFLAARLIIRGRDREVELRLDQVAPASMFRNTFLFGASGIFSAADHHQDFLVDLCREMDEDQTDSALVETRAGAQLALDVLEEGTVLVRPKWTRLMLERSCGVLELPPCREQAQLAQMAVHDRHAVVERAVGRALTSPEFHAGAWVCLTEALNLEVPWAIPLAEEAWPALTELDEFIQWLRQAEVRWGVWLGVRLDSRAAEVKAARLADFGAAPRDSRAAAAWSTWLGRRAFDALPGKEPKSPPPEPWLPWIASIRYLKEPSTDDLPDLLELIARALPPAEWETVVYLWSPWRGADSGWWLMACLRSAEAASDLLDYATRLRRGELPLQAGWEALGPTHPAQEVVEVTDAALERPWSMSEPQQAPVSVLAMASSFWRRPISAQVHAWADGHFDQATQPKLRRDLATVCLLSAEKARASLLKIRKWLAAIPGVEIPVPAVFDSAVNDLNSADWKVLWQAIRTGVWRWAVHTGLSPATQRFLLGNENPLLWEMVFSGNRSHVRHLGEIEHRRSAAAGARALLAEPASSTLEQVERTLLRLLLGPISNDEVSTLAAQLLELLPGHAALVPLLVEAIRQGHLPQPQRERLLMQVLPKLAHAHDRRALVSALRDVVQARRSGLDDPATWERLGLPQPFPIRHKGNRPDQQAWPGQPVHLRRLQFSNVRGLAQLELEPTLPKASEGQWLVVLGRNGTGKTTLLRGLALALRNLQDPAIWPDGCFSNRWPTMGVSEASITVTLAEQQHRTSIRQNGNRVIHQEPEQRRPRLFPLFAYGCRRGSALGGNSRAVDLGDEDGPEIATLFSERADLIHSETWLITWDGDRNEASQAIYRQIQQALCTLLEVQAIEVRDQQVEVVEASERRLPLSALSDGYLTTTGWFLDLLARWIDLARRNAQPIGPAFLTQMRGLVLIDELDLHLHPRWQVEIIGRIRKLLPQMSFVATTHNPLTLVGAHVEEIWILEEHEGRIRARQERTHPLVLTGGQILERFFEIEDVYPAEVGRQLARYAFLAVHAGRTEEEQAELERLSAELMPKGLYLPPVAPRRVQMEGPPATPKRARRKP